MKDTGPVGWKDWNGWSAVIFLVAVVVLVGLVIFLDWPLWLLAVALGCFFVAMFFAARVRT